MDTQGSISGTGFWERGDPDASRRGAAAVVETVDDPVVRLDTADCILAVNRAVADGLGYDRDDLRGAHVSALLGDETADRVSTAIESLRAGPDDVALLDASVRTATGERTRRELRVTPVEADGDHRGTVLVVADRADESRSDEPGDRDDHADERRSPELDRRFLDRVFEASPIGICALAPDGEVITFNDRAAEIFGNDPDGQVPAYDPDDWTLYDEDGDPIPPDDRAFRRVVETKETVRDFEAAVERRDGTRRWVSFNAVPVSGPDGDLSMVVVTYEDVTDRKAREQELERERHQTEQLLETAPIAIAVQDADGETVRANERAQEFLGLSEHELVHESRDATEWRLYDAHGDPLPSDRTPATRVLATGDPVYDEEIAIERPDGERIWLRVNATPVRDADGEVERVISAGENITDLKERERDLARRTQELETELGEILGRVSDAFFAVDEEFRFTHVNERAHELINPEGRDLIGENVWDEFPAATERKFKPYYERAMTEQETVSFEEYYPEPLDAWFEVRAYPSETGLSVYFRDVTDRKEREERYLALVEHFPNGAVTLFDEDLRYTLAAGQAFDDLAVDAADLEGAHVRDVWDDDTADALVPAFRAALDGERRSVEVEYAGREWVVYAIPVTDDEGNVFAGMTMAQDVTEQKERERSLRDAKSQLEAAAEAGAVGTWEWHIPEEEFVAGPSFARTFDVDPEAAREGVSLDRFVSSIHEDDRARVEAEIESALASCGEYEAEYRVWDADGELRWVVARGHVECDEDGDPVTFPGALTDITERKRAEQELEASEQRYRTLAESFPNGIVTLFDTDGEYTLAAGQAFDAIDADPGDVEGRHFREVWDDDTVAALEPVFDAVLAGREDSVELRYAGREWVLHGAPITDDDGEVFAGVTMAQDITDRKEHERELEKYETIVETINDGIYVVDEDGRYTMVNDAYAELTGYERDELLGEHATLVVDDETLDRASEIRTEMAQGSVESPALETTVETATGDEVPVEAAFASISGGDAEKRVGVVRDVTRRVEQRKQIEESERRYRTLVEHFPNGAVGLFDRDFRYTAVGGQLLDERDVDPDDRVGSRVHSIYPDELVAELEPYFEAALAGETNSFEVEFDGRYLSAYTLPIEDAEDEVTTGMLVVQDVTERREMEQELRESEAKFRMLAENLDEIVWMSTPDRQEMLYVNPTYEAVWGRDREQLYEDPMSFVDAIHPKDRERVREAYAALPDDEYEEEFRIVRPDGEVRWILAQAAPVRDDDGDVFRIVGIAEDVTERKKREQALEKSERRYRTLAEHFPNGAVGVYDHDLRYTLTEGAMLGDPLPGADRLEGSRVQDAFPDDTVADLRPLFRAAVDDGETGSVTTEFADRTWRVWATPLVDADGEIFAGLSFAQDITEQVEREQRLEELVERLEESNERLEQFAYAASHDLQEPLRMVSSYLSLIERRYEDELDDEGREFLEFAVDGADRMREMIDALLKYSRVETRGDPFEPVDLNDVVADARTDLQMKITETNADVSVASLPRVSGDEDQLRQVFQNLLDNALEYSGDDPPDVDVTAHRDGDRWVVAVRDDGIGIDADQRDSVFEVFQRLHTTEEHAGTGIGLALCRRIVERHDGEIWVESDPGEGSTFKFTLPPTEETDD